MKLTLTESNIKLVERSVASWVQKFGAWGGGVGLKQKGFVFLLALSFSVLLIQLFFLVAFFFFKDLLMIFFIDFSILGRDKVSDKKSMYFDAMTTT